MLTKKAHQHKKSRRWSRQRSRGSVLWPVVVAVIAAQALAPVSAVAEDDDDKSGVTPKTISRPAGPGSLEGLGDSFQPMLNTGTARYSVTLTLPEGVAGLTPGLSLSYDSGNGFGVVGVGWSVGPGNVRRQTDKGLPRYDLAPDGVTSPDRFLGLEGEELVPLQNGYYLAKVEGLFIRYRQVGDHWEAQTKSGNTIEFGLTPNARITDATGQKTYAWYPERQTDTHGNTITYAYTQDGANRQVYLSEIRYGPGPEPRDHSYIVTLIYEDRPDPFIDYRPGFGVRTAKRLTSVDVNYDDQLIRRYTFGYDPDANWSLLQTITQYGNDGVSTLPVTTFDYRVFNPGDPGTPISAAGQVITSAGALAAVVDRPNIEFVDLNADALPDMLCTDAGHTAYLNCGPRDNGDGIVIDWQGPVQVEVEDDRVNLFELQSDNVHLADMTGDGLADLVVKDAMGRVEYFKNTGRVAWGPGQLMSVEERQPPAPFAEEGWAAQLSDLNFNKRIDIIQSEYGGLLTWFNEGDGTYAGPIVTPGVFYGHQPVELGDPTVHLADMNGDRLNDIVQVSTYSVVYWANMGYARFDEPVEMMLPDRGLDDSPSGNLYRAKLTDISGDGLSDLVVERAVGTDVWLWVNRGDGTFDQSRVVRDLPYWTDPEVRWADINGNGTTDLIYADSSQPDSKLNAVDLAELVGGSAHFNLLTGIANGYGRKSTVGYRSTTEFARAALDLGNPWELTVPFPTQVVARVETSTGLDLDDYPDEGPNGDVYLTDYVYRDGYYDPIEKQFRGFAFVKVIQHGDERFGGDSGPTLVTRHGFHTGAPDGLDNDGDGDIDEAGDLWTGREEEPLKGVALWQEVTSLPDDPTRDGQFADDAVVFERQTSAWTVRNLCTADGGLLNELLAGDYRTADAYGREVRHAVGTEVLKTIIERGQGEPKTLRTVSDVDALGDSLYEWQYGDVENPRDNIYTGYEYARDESVWIMDRVARTYQTDGGQDGEFVSDVRTYYDGEPFVGLPLGEIGSNGLPHRVEALVSNGSVPPLTEQSYRVGDPRDPDGRVDTSRQRFDDYGNPVVFRDARGYDRNIEYDDTLHKFPVRETIVIGGDSDPLVVEATYDFALGVPRTITDFNDNVSTFEFDTFGRLRSTILPGDDPAAPTSTYTYQLGSPVSSITTTAHTNLHDAPDVVTQVFFDSLGRKLATYEPGGPVMSGVSLFDPRGQARKVYRPYEGGDGTWSLPPADYPADTNRYDATGRVMETITPPDADGLTARITREYRPLAVLEYDGEDNNAGGPHHDTPKTLISDGLGRLIEVHEIETLSAVDSGTFITQYRYALPDHLAEIEDANGNIKYMRYDGLGRRFFMNDLDRGHMTYTFDAAGNLISTVDAKSQEIVYTYDGANRLLTTDYLDSGHPLSFERTPDIAYHYDVPPTEASPEPPGGSPDGYPVDANTKGQLAWVEDLTGAEFRAYDIHGNPETIIKRIDQIEGGTEDYTTITRSDSLGRTYEIVYPDGFTIQQQFDARGMLMAIPGFLEQATYFPTGQKESMVYGNGVITNYTYDPRGRLRTLITESPTELLQHMTYDFDQADNIVAITDGRDLPLGDPRSQTAEYVMDNLYRLQRAIGEGYGPGGGGGAIHYDYDRLGNMALKISHDIPDPDVDIGMMLSGGDLGTSGRIGRGPDDPPGPHAITSTAEALYTRRFEYDANGNMTLMDMGDIAPFAGTTGPEGEVSTNGEPPVDMDGDLDVDLQDFAYYQQYFTPEPDRPMTLVYDFADRIGCVANNDHEDIRYRYDATGQRIVKRIDSALTMYINELSEVRNGEPVRYIFGGDARLVQIDADGQTFYYHSGHTGSTNFVTDGMAQLVSESDNYPFGLLRYEHEAEDSFDPHYQFADKEEDAESGLYYFTARFYAPIVARFVVVDPLFAHNPQPSADNDDPFGELRIPLKLNLFSYVRNNPLRFVDPSGLDEDPVLMKYREVFGEIYDKLQTSESERKKYPGGYAVTQKYTREEFANRMATKLRALKTVTAKKVTLFGVDIWFLVPGCNFAGPGNKGWDKSASNAYDISAAGHDLRYDYEGTGVISSIFTGTALAADRIMTQELIKALAHGELDPDMKSIAKFTIKLWTAKRQVTLRVLRTRLKMYKLGTKIGDVVKEARDLGLQTLKKISKHSDKSGTNIPQPSGSIRG